VGGGSCTDDLDCNVVDEESGSNLGFAQPDPNALRYVAEDILISDGTSYEPGNQALDTVFVDQLIIRGDDTVPTDPPAAPVNLQVVGATSSSLTLSWEHDGDDEQGFDLQRSPAGAGSWSDVPGPAGGSTGRRPRTLPQRMGLRITPVLGSGGTRRHD